ncbi:hydrolase [Marinovum sp.]|uniref:hydrolase n=1 Tax=Marinovum sp. TaxID=2024839 RepID=UPI003A90201C
MKLKTLGATLVAFTLSLTAAQAADPADSLLTPDNHTLLLIDHQPQMAFATKSIDVAELRNNTVGLAKSARLFEVPTILTTVAAESFSGRIFPEIQDVFPEQAPIDRSTMNTWEDDNVVDVIEETGRKKIVMAGLWTEVCIVLPALSALQEGYDVYVVTDASGGVTDEAHDMAVQRMIDAGATPITWVQYLLELQRDWARGETYAGTLEIAKEHAGGYGLGVIYAEQMFNAKEGQ